MWTNDEMQNKLGQIHNQDCLTFMKQVPDKYFDLVLTDIDNRCKYRYNLQS